MAERQCLRCGAPYDEGATVCFTCGASIGELETPTQPVRAPKRPAAPEATEPAPTEQPQSEAPATTVTPGSSHPLTVGSGYRAPTPVVTPRAPLRIRWPLAVALLVVVVALATGGFFAGRALLAPKPIPTSITYHDAQRRFSFTEPALWTVTRRADGALLTDSSGANTIIVSVAMAPGASTASAVADALAAQQGLTSAPDVTIAGEQWQQRAGSVTGADGATRTVTLYVDIHAGSVYTIQTSSPTSVSSSMSTLVYQPLLASFTFS